MTRNIQYKKLGEICNFISGGTPSKSKNEYWKNGNIPWIKISDFKEKYIKFSEEKITKIGLENSSAKILKKGTILYTIFASVGKVAILDIEATTNQAVVGINLKEDNSIDKDFLYYFLCSIENNIKKQARGVAQNNINISILKNINIPILPMAFQKNIVKTLNKLENILENFKQKKLLINFLNKSLFSRMFGDIKTNDKNWEIKKFHEIISILTDYHANGSYKILKDNVELLDFKEYALMIRTTDLENNNFIQGVKYINEKAYNFLKKTKILGGELIINKIGSAGNVYLMPYLNIPVSLGMNQFMIRFKKDYSNIFYYKLLTTEYYTNVIKSNVQGAVTKTITKEAIKNIDIIIPPIELQKKFAERIEKIEKLSFEIEKSIKEAENLYNSLISKYFD